jgi:hypothetical protein
MAGALAAGRFLRRRDGGRVALIRRWWFACPKISLEPRNLRQKRHSRHAAARDGHLRSGIMTDFDDNVIIGIVAFGMR